MGHAQVCEWAIPCSIKGIFSSACDQALRSQPHICFPFPFFVSIIWEGDMPGQCHRATVIQKIMFPVGTTLRRSKHEHVVTGLSRLHLSYLFNLPVCVYLFCFLFSSLRKGKACHNLTGYVITVKFMLFCNLETSYSMAHLIKHLDNK